MTFSIRKAAIATAITAILFPTALAVPSSPAYAEPEQTPLEVANANLEQAQQAYQQAQSELDAANANLAELSAEVTNAKEELAKRKESAASSIQTMYRTYSEFDILLASLLSCDTLNDFIWSIDNMHLIFANSVRAVKLASDQEKTLTDKMGQLEPVKSEAESKSVAADQAMQQAEQAQQEARRALLSSDAGLAMAQLASAVACTWYPDDRITDSDGDPWTWDNRDDIAKYRRLGEAVMANTPEHRKKDGYPAGYNNWAWSSCHQAACVIIKAVADPDVNMGCPELGEEYFQNTPDRWAYVGSTSRADDPMLKPGDILNITSPFTHTSIFLGHDAVEMFHPGCDGVVFEASYSNGRCRYPGITGTGVGGSLGATYNVYRFVGTPVDSVGISDYL